MDQNVSAFLTNSPIKGFAYPQLPEELSNPTDGVTGDPPKVRFKYVNDAGNEIVSPVLTWIGIPGSRLDINGNDHATTKSDIEGYKTGPLDAENPDLRRRPLLFNDFEIVVPRVIEREPGQGISRRSVLNPSSIDPEQFRKAKAAARGILQILNNSANVAYEDPSTKKAGGIANETMKKLLRDL